MQLTVLNMEEKYNKIYSILLSTETRSTVFIVTKPLVNNLSKLLTCVLSSRRSNSNIIRQNSTMHVVEWDSDLKCDHQNSHSFSQVSWLQAEREGTLRGGRPPVFQTSRTSSNRLPTYHKLFTVGRLGSLEFIYGEQDAVPHICGPRSAERLGLVWQLFTTYGCVLLCF